MLHVKCIHLSIYLSKSQLTKAKKQSNIATRNTEKKRLLQKI